jgi:hypothetical protein
MSEERTVVDMVIYGPEEKVSRVKVIEFIATP